MWRLWVNGAHAMPPYLGQGGGTALMNGPCHWRRRLSTQMRARSRSGWPPGKPSERPLTEHTQEQSERLGDMNFWPDALRAEVNGLDRQEALSLLTCRMRTRAPRTSRQRPRG